VTTPPSTNTPSPAPRSEGQFAIIEVRRASIELLEQIGTKEKFWFADAGRERTLCKVGRADTGEDWAEKISEEIAKRLGLPCARYELASCDGESAVVSPQFVKQDEALIHGNELLSAHNAVYREDIAKTAGRSRLYTVPLVLEALQKRTVQIHPDSTLHPPEVRTARDVFTGYLLLDAVVGNTDRHHQNWGVIRRFQSPKGDVLLLAPTYDHASSLGRNESDARRHQLLDERDGAGVSRYARKAKSCFYSTNESAGKQTTREAFATAALACPHAAKAWLDRLQALDEPTVARIIDSVPEVRASSIARRFAAEMIRINRTDLLLPSASQ
jgi:hypothetical protein